MLKIGLTGGIGSGKSTACEMFQSLGVPVIDTDVIAKQITQPGQAALITISAQFGSNIINKKGELDRQQLRQLIFSDDTQRHKLESILHPLIKKQVLKAIEQHENDTTRRSTYIIIVVPLLLESDWTELFDRVLVIDTSIEQQIQRSKGRDNVSEDHIRSIIQQQIDRQSRCAAADDIIHNDNDLATLKKQVLKLHKNYTTTEKQ